PAPGEGAWWRRSSPCPPPRRCGECCQRKPRRGRDQDGSHTSLRNHSTERNTPARMSARPPAAATGVTSTVLCVWPTREPSSAYVALTSTAPIPLTYCPPLRF